MLLHLFENPNIFDDTGGFGVCAQYCSCEVISTLLFIFPKIVLIFVFLLGKHGVKKKYSNFMLFGCW